MLTQRRSLLPDERDAQSRRIIDRLLTNSVFTNAKNIFCYLSRDDEVSTGDFITEALKTKQIFLPKICDDLLVPTRFTGETNLVKGLYGILEPQCPVMPSESLEIDLILLPGVAFDTEGNRLGMGKGYYDRYLKTIPAVTTVGLAFDFQVVDKVPTDDYDVPVSFVVTPNEFYTCKPTTSNRS